jgi:CBS domain-containing protein
MTVAAVLKQKGSAIVSVSPEASMTEIADIIATRRIGALVVLDTDNRIVGIVSERDVVKAVAAHRERALSMKASELMTPKPTTAGPDTSVDEAMQIMDTGYFRHLPVLQDGRLIGIISVRDLVKYRIMQQKADLEDLTSYVFRVGS